MATSEPSDDALMNAYAAATPPRSSGSTRATRPALYRFVRRLLGAALAAQTDEVFQDTWLRVVHARARWAAAGRDLSHLAVHARAPPRDRPAAPQRPRGVDRRFEGDGDEPWQPDAAAWQHWPAPAGAAPQSDELAFWRRAGEKLLDCLEQLPLPQRSAFLLHHDDGLTLDEVAHALEVGFETAKTRLRYAMSKLRTCMGAYLAPRGCAAHEATCDERRASARRLAARGAAPRAGSRRAAAERRSARRSCARRAPPRARSGAGRATCGSRAPARIHWRQSGPGWRARRSPPASPA